MGIPAFVGAALRGKAWALALVPLLALLARPAVAAELVTLGGRTMGTTWSVRVAPPDGVPATRVAHGIQAALDTVDAQMSTWKPGSDLSRFNRARAGSCPVLPPAFFTVLRHALDVARDSGGAYDPTVGPLVGLWGFGPGEQAHRPPSEQAIAAARRRVGWQRIRIDPATRRACQPGGVSLDLSAVAKGYGVDQVGRYLDGLGARAWLVEVGGELKARGRKPDGTPWRVGVERPDAAAGAVERADQLAGAVRLEDRAIATSGDYRHAFEDHGRTYSHHIDPRTGRPVPHRLASVSVLAPDAMAADPIGTTLMVLGPEEGMAWARARHLAVLFVLRTPQGFERRMTRAFAAAWEARP